MIPAAELRPDLAAHRRNVDDFSIVLLPHGRGHKLNEPRHAKEVHVELTAAFLQRYILDGAIRAVPGVVDQHIDASGAAEHPVHAGTNGIVHRQIKGNRLNALGFQVLHAIHAPRSGIDLKPCRFQFLCDHPADTAGRARDQCCFFHN